MQLGGRRKRFFAPPVLAGVVGRSTGVGGVPGPGSLAAWLTAPHPPTGREEAGIGRQAHCALPSPARQGSQHTPPAHTPLSRTHTAPPSLAKKKEGRCTPRCRREPRGLAHPSEAVTEKRVRAQHIAKITLWCKQTNAVRGGWRVGYRVASAHASLSRRATATEKGRQQPANPLPVRRSVCDREHVGGRETSVPAPPNPPVRDS